MANTEEGYPSTVTGNEDEKLYLSGVYRRLDQIRFDKNLTRGQFINLLGATGGFFNKNTDFGITKLKALHETFPEISLNWVLFEEGKITGDDNMSMSSEGNSTIIKDLIEMIKGKDELLAKMTESLLEKDALIKELAGKFK